MIKHSSHQKSSEVRNIEARVVDHHTNVSVLQDFVEDVPRLASKEMASDLKILINAVADDSSQLVHSDRKILTHVEKDQDRLYQQVVLQNRLLTGAFQKLKKN